MADGAEQDVDDVSLGTFERVSFEMTVLLHVADDRLDGVSSSQFRVWRLEVVSRKWWKFSGDFPRAR